PGVPPPPPSGVPGRPPIQSGYDPAAGWAIARVRVAPTSRAANAMPVDPARRRKSRLVRVTCGRVGREVVAAIGLSFHVETGPRRKGSTDPGSDLCGTGHAWRDGHPRRA